MVNNKSVSPGTYTRYYFYIAYSLHYDQVSNVAPTLFYKKVKVLPITGHEGPEGE
jgi:hypothetical protein